MNIVVKRGDIFWADLGNSTEVMMGGVRPVIIIQNDIANEYSRSVIVAAITTRIKKYKLPTNVELPNQHGLSKNSLILLEEVFTLNKSVLEHKIGTVGGDILKKLDRALDISFGRSVEKEFSEDKKRKGYIEQLEQLAQPLVITEGKTDVVLIETAWRKLYPNIEMPFKCESSGIQYEKEKRQGSADSVRRQIQDYSTVLKNPIIGLFDNDKEGNEQFKGLDKGEFEEYDIDNLLRKHRNVDVWGMLLPVPSERKLFAESSDVTQRYFVIEHYFSDYILKKHSMYGNNILGTSVFKVNNRKKDFAQEVSELEAKEFEGFRILFDKIKEIFNIK